MYDSVYKKDNITLVTLSDISAKTAVLAELFNKLGNNGVFVDMICRPTDYCRNTRLAFTIDDENLYKAMCSVASTGVKSGAFSSGCCKISVKDERFAVNCGESGVFFEKLANHGVDVLLVTTDFDEISVLIRPCDFENAMNALKN